MLDAPNYSAADISQIFCSIAGRCLPLQLGSPAVSLFPASIANFGYEAVTFFFVLSGFILTYTHGIPDAGLNIPWRTFLIARLVRLCPAYYLAIIAILLPFFVAGLSDRISVGKTIPVLLMVQAWTKQSALGLNPPAWSISNELFFYVVFPAVWNTNRFISTIAFVAGSAALVVLVAVARSMHPDGSTGEAIGAYFPLANLPQFLFGVGLARLWLETPRLRYTALFLLGMASIIALMAFMPTFSWLTNDVSLCAAFGLTVLGAAGIRGSLDRFRSSCVHSHFGFMRFCLNVRRVPPCNKGTGSRINFLRGYQA